MNTLRTTLTPRLRLRGNGLVVGETYRCANDDGALTVRCLNVDTRQFRVLAHESRPEVENVTGWLISISEEVELFVNNLVASG